MLLSLFFFFFNDTATTEIYTLSLHDALPIEPISVEAHRNTRLSRPKVIVAFHGVRCCPLTWPNQRGNTRSRPMANEIRPALTMAACSEASVPPSTATIMTFSQPPPPI